MATELVPMPMEPAPLPEACEGFVLAHWNRQFLCYCFARGGGDPLQQVIDDGRLWPDAPLGGFLVWYAAEWDCYMDEFEPQWRGWEADYRRKYRQMHDQAFGLWLWDRHAPKQDEPRRA